MNQKVYMTDQEFTARMAALIPAPNAVSAPVIKCKKTPRKKCN